MPIGNSIPIDVSLLEDIEQSAFQLSSQLEALLSSLQSQLHLVKKITFLKITFSPACFYTHRHSLSLGAFTSSASLPSPGI